MTTRPMRWVLLLASMAIAATALGDIAGSHHNFGKRVGGNSQQICNPCHTPHNASLTERAAPLWNHAVTTSTFTPYTSPTMDAPSGQPGGVTKLCLSCHDGTVAIDSFDGRNGTQMIVRQANLGTNLQMHHPISIRYDSALAAQDGGLWDPSTTASGLGGTIQSDLLRGDRLECVSCHDVHVSRSTGACSDCHGTHGGSLYKETKSLWKSNALSAFCLTCHKK